LFELIDVYMRNRITVCSGGEYPNNGDGSVYRSTLSQDLGHARRLPRTLFTWTAALHTGDPQVFTFVLPRTKRPHTLHFDDNNTYPYENETLTICAIASLRLRT